MYFDNLEKEINSFFENLFYAVFRGVKLVFKGVRRLNSVPRIVWLIVGIFISVFLLKNNEEITNVALSRIEDFVPTWVFYLVFGIAIGLPIIYLLLLGQAVDGKQKKYQQAFEQIGFKSRNGQYPYMVKLTKEKVKKTLLKKSRKRKEIYLFKSAIPMSEWMRCQEALEVALDCNILRFAEGKSKKLIKIITVPTDCKIPSYVVWKDTNIQDKDGVMVLGESAIDTVGFDLNKTPHILVAGETGSGKSVTLRTLLWQFIKKESRVFMIDFKGGVEFGKQYEQFGEVITKRSRAIEVLDLLIQENKQRLDLFREMEVKNLPQYNERSENKLCRIGVFCDEIAEMLDKKGTSGEVKKQIEILEGQIATLARLSRATGINLILGVQRPDANVLTGQIKNNVPVRVCGRFADKAASEIVLGNTDAVYLPDIKGRFLFRLGNETMEFQSYWFDDEVCITQGSITLDSITQGGMLVDGVLADKEPVYTESKILDVQDKKRKEKKTNKKKDPLSEGEKMKQWSEQIDNLETFSKEDYSKSLEDKLDFDFNWSCEKKGEEI